MSVEGVSVKTLLFAIARDGKLDIDLAPDIEGTITMQAREQTLTQLMDRITRQTELRWDVRGRTLVVERDTPLLRHYRVDYVSMARESESTVNVSSQVGGGAGGSSGGGQSNNSSSAMVKNKSESKFWETLINNVQDLLRETDKVLPTDGQAAGGAPATATPAAAQPAAAVPGVPGMPGVPGIPGTPGAAAAPPAAGAAAAPRPIYREAASVIANPITGMISVRATARQHEKVREFIDRVLAAARRQVLIEATVVEVSLNKQSQTGIDWKNLALGAGFSSRANFLGTALDAIGSVASPNSTLLNLISGIQADSNLTTAQKSNLVNQISAGMGVRTLNTTEFNNLINSLVGSGWTFEDAKTYAESVKTSPSSSAKLPLSYTETFAGGVFPYSGDTRGFTLGYGNGSNFATAVKLLGQYGNVKVVSSPKVTTLNNQPAVLRVVDNLVYFTIVANTTAGSTGASLTTYTSTPNTVAVGFVMSVQPQIDDGQVVTLNVRPTITRLRGYARDPNPALQAVPSYVPIVQTKELESIMKVPSGQIVMLGGLMEDSQERDAESLPGLEESPAAGLFGTRNSKIGKTELVIFLRPVVITDPSLDGDYSRMRDLLPSRDFFSTSPAEKAAAMRKETGQ